MFKLFNHRAGDVETAARLHDGVQVAEGDPFGCVRAPFPLLRRGDRRTVERVLWREDDPHAVKVFDYRYERTWGSERVRSPLFTCATALANASWPYVEIDPATMASDLAGPFAGDSRITTLDDAFDDAFVVNSTDQRFAAAFLDAPTRAFLLDKARALSIDLNGAWLMVSAEDVPPRLLPALFGFIGDLLEHLEKPTRAISPGPLPGDLHRPMPDPARIAAELGEAGRDFERAAEGSVTQMSDVLMGFSRIAPQFVREASYAAGTEAVEQAIHRQMLDDPAWDSMVESRLDALSKPEDIEYDIDGNQIPRGVQNPWGEGRTPPPSP